MLYLKCQSLHGKRAQHRLQALRRLQTMLERIHHSQQEARKAEERLREKEAQYRGTFEAAIDGLISTLFSTFQTISIATSCLPPSPTITPSPQPQRWEPDPAKMG